jgi:hypothetical protein
MIKSAIHLITYSCICSNPESNVQKQDPRQLLRSRGSAAWLSLESRLCCKYLTRQPIHNHFSFPVFFYKYQILTI